MGKGTYEATLRGYRNNVDTNLIPPRAQYGATLGKEEQSKPPRNAAFARLCNPLQRMMDHS